MSLTIGITCFIFLMLYAKYELSYDSFHENSSRIYQVGQHFKKGDFFGYKYTFLVSAALVPALKKDFPEIEYAVRTKNATSSITYDDKHIKAKGLLADQDFFNIFKFPIKTGNKNNVLKKPFTIVLSESLAGKLFGSENPIGKVIEYDEPKNKYTVTAIVKDTPGNTNLKFDFLVSFTAYYSNNDKLLLNWRNSNYSSYILIKDKIAVSEFERKVTHIGEKYDPALSKIKDYFILPLNEVHLAGYIRPEHANEGALDKGYIYAVISIAFVILLIGCANYINIATARAEKRNKEVGIRKTIGATHLQLFKQFLGESFILTFLSIILSLLIVVITFPYFRNAAENGIELNILIDWTTVIGLFLLSIAVGFLAGGYPAFLLSSLKPVNILKNIPLSRSLSGRFKLRNILVAFQFCISIILITAALIIQKQLYFIKNSDIGYTRDNIIAVKMSDKESRVNYQLIKNELSKNPNIIAVSAANVEPVTIQNINPTEIENEKGEMILLNGLVSNYTVDYDYVNLFSMKIIKGRNFESENSGDNNKQVIINETAARMAGLTNPIGKKLIRNDMEMNIIGVVKDFNFVSMKKKIDPLVITYSPERFYTFFVKISDINVEKTVMDINTVFKKYSSNFVYDYSFMDELYDGLYKKESNLAGIVITFSIIAIIIVSMGLFGFISFIVGNKTKEIGIRKILGASFLKIIWLLTKQFIVLILIAFVISIPVAYYFTNEWLKEFVYHIELSVWLFGIAGTVIIIITFSSIALQTIKAATSNAVDSLRSE